MPTAADHESDVSYRRQQLNLNRTDSRAKLYFEFVILIPCKSTRAVKSDIQTFADPCIGRDDDRCRSVRRVGDHHLMV